MIRLFVLDLDGCMSHPFQTPHWESVTRIRAYNQQSRTDTSIPPLSICTGRPMPYAEAYAQWLDIEHPFVFESGAGLYEPLHQRLHWTETANGEMLAKVQEMRTWAEDHIVEKIPGTLLEFAKKWDVGLIQTNHQHLQEIVDTAGKRITGNGNLFEVHRTDVSVNIILKMCNKGTGIEWISRVTGIPVSEIAYIGDSSGDISALRIVQPNAYCPSNASDDVKAEAHTMPAETSHAVLMAYEDIIRKNRTN